MTRLGRRERGNRFLTGVVGGGGYRDRERWSLGKVQGGAEESSHSVSVALGRAAQVLPRVLWERRHSEFGLWTDLLSPDSAIHFLRCSCRL